MGALISNSVSTHEQGQVIGISASLTGLTSVLGPLWAGAAYDYLMPSAPYWTSALSIAVAATVLACTRQQITLWAPE